MNPGDGNSLVGALENLIERFESEKADPDAVVLEVQQAKYAIRKHKKAAAAGANVQPGQSDTGLRDEFAGKAMQALLPIYDANLNFDLCKRAYKVADSMLEARKQ